MSSQQPALAMNLPVIDLDVFLAKPVDHPEVIEECKKASH